MASRHATPEDRDLAHFLAIPWCAEHLTAPGITALIPSSRLVKEDSTEDGVISTTLNTPDTIPFFTLFFKSPPLPTDRVDEIKGFLTLGGGLDGWPGVCHGGIVVTILDELLGLLAPINIKRGAIPHVSYMTAYLNTSFVAPVRTPGTVLVTSRIVRMDGRKVYVEGHVWDAEAKLLAKGDALFVGLKERL